MNKLRKLNVKKNNFQKSNRYPPHLISQRSYFSWSLVLLKLFSDADHPNIVSRYTVFFISTTLYLKLLYLQKNYRSWSIQTFSLLISTLSLMISTKGESTVVEELSWAIKARSLDWRQNGNIQISFKF